MAADKLSDQEKVFIAEYLIDRNGTRAAKAAGYTATNISFLLLKKEKIRKEIDKRIAAFAGKLEVDAERVLKEYAKVAFANPCDFLEMDENDKPRVKSLDELDSDQKAAISSFKVRYDSLGQPIVTLNFHDKLRGLEALSKHLGLFAKDNAQKKPESIHIGVLNQLINILPAEQQQALRFSLQKAIAASSDENVIDVEATETSLVPVNSNSVN